MSTKARPGQPAPRELLIDPARLQQEYYRLRPDPAEPGQRVSFGTSGHRGSASARTFNERHILAISQAICDWRQGQGITGPLFLGRDTHALSEPAYQTALEVFAGNGVPLVLQHGDRPVPTPVISHAILAYNRRGENRKAEKLLRRVVKERGAKMVIAGGFGEYADNTCSPSGRHWRLMSNSTLTPSRRASRIGSRYP